MLKLVRTDSSHADFRELVRLLDEDLSLRDGAAHPFYAQFNTLDAIRHVVVAYEQDRPVGCGAIKRYDETTVEIKRMFVRPENRGRGIAAAILRELEQWAAELGFATAILETGKQQPEAIRLYQKSGYTLMPNYGQYALAQNSVCMQKPLMG
ncbi:MAG: GNAT family N-acetyltransferase [Abitibacteriaceae bacterium]|nr:GNAT family N-acetyltransferase [Abditibacteriaceae bacterium]MBV9865746.1 GNAT family N-acetyltransferase [Abditibacteriaceae bacterium]